MHDSEDMYGYDEPILPYVPYSDRQDKQGTHDAQNTGSTEALGVPPTHQDSSFLVSAGEPYGQSTPYAPYAHADIPAYVSGETQTQPTSDAEVVAALPKRRSRRAVWITLASVFVLLVIVAGSTFALVSYLNRSTPLRTLDTFCAALQKEDYGSAYNQFTKQLQRQFTEGDFAGVIQQNKVTSCTHGKANETGVRVTTSLTLKHADRAVNNDLVMLAKGADSIWLIDDLQRAS